MTRLSRAAIAFVTAAGMAAACATSTRFPTGAPTPERSSIELTLLDVVVIPPETRPPAGRRDAWFGSLSGLARDPRSGRYLAVIDDRLPARLTWLDISTDAGRLVVEPGEVLAVQPSDGLDVRVVTGADLEAVVALPDGRWVVSEEGHYSTGVPGQPPKGDWPPALLTLGPDLRVTRIQAWPSRFALGTGQGVRDNQGFESLTRTPDGRLIAGLEQPLLIDRAAVQRNGRPFSGGRGGPGRLIELVDEAGDWLPRREWVYPLEPTVMRPGEEICDDGENGLTDLLALDDTRLLAIERACLLRPGVEGARVAARIYAVDVTDADDVSPGSGGDVDTARPVTKSLLLDFDTLIPRFPAALARLDNFEALAFGPTLPDGRRTLLVMSDDNFRPTQNTVLVWLAIGRR